MDNKIEFLVFSSHQGKKIVKHSNEGDLYLDKNGQLEIIKEEVKEENLESVRSVVKLSRPVAVAPKPIPPATKAPLKTIPKIRRQPKFKHLYQAFLVSDDGVNLDTNSNFEKFKQKNYDQSLERELAVIVKKHDEEKKVWASKPKLLSLKDRALRYKKQQDELKNHKDIRKFQKD